MHVRKKKQKMGFEMLISPFFVICYFSQVIVGNDNHMREILICYIKTCHNLYFIIDYSYILQIYKSIYIIQFNSIEYLYYDMQ